MQIKNKKNYNKFIFGMKENYEKDLESLIDSLQDKKQDDEMIIDNKKVKIISNKKFINNNKDSLNSVFYYLEKFDGIVFYKCIFDNINIKINLPKNIYYLNCIIENSIMEFKCKKYTYDSKGKIYLLNTLFNKLVLENSLSSIFIYNNYYKDDILGIKLIDCTNCEVIVINENNNIFNLILENSKYLGIYIYSLRKLITSLDEQSNTMKYLYYNLKFANNIEINSLKEITSKYYRYLKINYDENRFAYYEILKYLEYLLGNRYKKIGNVLFKHITGYFIKPKKILLICAIIIIISSILYLITGIRIDDNTVIKYSYNNLSSVKFIDVFKSIYLSIITFSTLGYGNIVPMHYGEVVACVEMLLGAIYISIFTGTIFKRYID